VTEAALAVLAGMVLHEAAHAFIAEVYGDATPRLCGRLTLNPLPHLHPVGSIALPALTLWLVGFPFGYMRALPLDRSAYTRAQFAGCLLAGPAANLALALALYVGGFYLGASVNIALSVFNLVPIGTTDGAQLLKLWRTKR